jgi:D-alanyl-D-alanine dipeptidase
LFTKAAKSPAFKTTAPANPQRTAIKGNDLAANVVLFIVTIKINRFCGENFNAKTLWSADSCACCARTAISAIAIKTRIKPWK